jgi:N-acetylneuraminic acid mutarotase
MRRSVAAILVLVFLVAPYILVVMPAFSSAGVAGNTWVSKAQMHQARYGLGVAVVNGKIYAIGGYAENGVVGTNEEYDPATDTWTYKTSMPTPMAEFATAVYQNKIYCIRESVNQVYDPATDTWTTQSPMPTAQWVVHANLAGGKICTIGGAPNKTLNQVYDPATDTWTAKASMPIDAGGPSAVFDNKIYVIGGFFDELTGNFKTVTQIYDPETDEWSQCKPPPTFVVYGFAEATSGMMAPKRIYVFGWPYGDSAGMPDDPFYTNQVYDPEGNSWVAGAGIPTSRCMFGAAVVNDLLYVIGGFTETFDMFWNSDVTLYAANEQYTPFGYGTPDPSYDGIAPEIAVASPQNKTYFTSDVGMNFTGIALEFTGDEPIFSVHFILDGGTPIEISGNTTIAESAVGAHKVTVFGFDASGNMGTSETIYFTIEVPEPFPVVPVAAASLASVGIIAMGLLVYFRKRKH